MKIILHWLAISLAVFLTAYFLPDINLAYFYTAIIIGAVLTLINYTVKPIIKIITLPINILTLGLFSLVINGLIFYFLGHIISGFYVADFMSAFYGALIVSVLNWILSKFLIID
ncbi:phage holin family protein [Candidatus Nomurabacteria bacterium]|nr:phage holin family protein [Candidatus Nomurabacteria bacterium]